MSPRPDKSPGLEPACGEQPVGSPAAVVLPAGWFTFVVADGVDCHRPGLREWKIDGIGTYIGKYKTISRPKRAYTLNVTRMLNDRAHRKGKPDRYRRIHCEPAPFATATT